MQSFYIALFQAESLLKALYITTPAIGLFIQGPSQLPGEHTAELQIRGRRYRLHNHKCHHYQLGTPLTHG
jgi:hypothetical protein